MAYYITILAQSLAAVALVAALWPVAAASGTPRQLDATVPLALLAGVIVGAAAVMVAVTAPRSATTVATLVHTAALTVAIAGLPLTLAAARGEGGVWRRAAGAVLVTGLAAQGVFDAWRLSANHTMTATDVINTELIVNWTAIAVALAALAGFCLLLARVARLAGRAATVVALLAALVLLVIAGTEKSLLGMLRIDAIPVTAERVSFVARQVGS